MELIKYSSIICMIVFFQSCSFTNGGSNKSYYQYYNDIDIFSKEIVNSKLEGHHDDTLGKFKVFLSEDKPIAIKYFYKGYWIEDSVVYNNGKPTIIHEFNDTEVNSLESIVRPIIKVIQCSYKQAVVYTLRKYATSDKIGLYSIDTFYGNKSTKIFFKADYRQNVYDNVFDFIRKIPSQNLSGLFSNEEISYSYDFFKDSVSVIENIPLVGSPEFGKVVYNIKIYRPNSFFSTIIESYLGYPQYLDSSWSAFRK